MTFKRILPLLTVFWIANLHAQEFTLPLHQNPGKSEAAFMEINSQAKTKTDILSLPFWDDFTNPGPYPDPGNWLDQYVFINTGFAVHPKTYGVATFDILDASGKIYDHATIDNIPFAADKLTSRAISLENYSPADSVLLSFYYQPQGTGAPPANNDSLVLQFRLPANHESNNNENDNDEQEDDSWQSVWHAVGESLESFAQDTFPYFERVAVPITEEKYFHEHFQFRFKNYASFAPGVTIPNYSGTGNIWNIDYVYLDANRSITDSTYFDIAFAAPAQSMLQDLTAMPWSQYISNPQEALRSNFQVSISNLDGVSYNYDYKYIIQDEGENTIRTYSAGSWVIDPFFEEGYQGYAPHANPIVLANPLPTAPAEERAFQIIHALQQGSDGDDFRRNDTLVYNQHFSDYFSYDNGSPELIHLVKGGNPGRALQFHASHADTIKSVDIFLMETINNQDVQRAYEIFIWDSLDPENVIYHSEEQFVPEDDEDKGRSFVRYDLTQDAIVEGTFYVGFRQQGTVLLSNAIVVGFDKSNNVSHRLFFDSGDGWLDSEMNGALMMRPVMKRDYVTGISEPGNEQEFMVSLYPNPASGNHIHVEPENDSWNTKNARIQILDVRGRLVQEQAYSRQINISSLQNGVYLLRLSNQQTGQYHALRFIIAR